MVMLAGARRFVWNWGLARRREHYEVTGKALSYFDQTKELTQLKKQPELAWLNEVTRQSSERALKDLDNAFKSFFAGRCGFPQFAAKRTSAPTFYSRLHVRVENESVKLPKLGWVRIRQSREVEGVIKDAICKQAPDGKWYISLSCEFTMPDVPLPSINPHRTVGVDLGLKDLAVLSNGERIAPPKHYRRAERKLARAQRALSRKQKGSRNREKARRRLAQVHQKIRNQRQDFTHKFTTYLVKNYDGICIEDLNVKGLAKTKLAKSINDAAFGAIRRHLEYKAVWYRKHLVVIDRFFPSSKLCSECGGINQDLILNDRSWICGCGAIHDRDLNAAKNIRLAGLKQLDAVEHTESSNACGAQVRPATAGTAR